MRFRRMRAATRDHFLQIVQISWLEVHYVEASAGVMQVPQIDAQVVCGQEGLEVVGGLEAVNVEVVSAFKRGL